MWALIVSTEEYPADALPKYTPRYSTTRVSDGICILAESAFPYYSVASHVSRIPYK